MRVSLTLAGNKLIERDLGGPVIAATGLGDEFPVVQTTVSRRLSSQDLQLVILALLAEKPAHGYELIKIIGSAQRDFTRRAPA